MNGAVRLAMRWPTLVVASGLHYAWALMLLMSADAAGSTPLYPTRSLPSPVVAFAFLFFAHLGLWAITRPKPSWWTMAALIPQQIMLVVSSVAIIVSVWDGRFLDGVERSREFLFADHAAVLALTIMHTFVLVAMHSGILNDHAHPEGEDG